MYCISEKIIREYEYDNEILMKVHEKEMIHDGWGVTKTSQTCFSGGKTVENNLYREYIYYGKDDLFDF